MSVTTTKLHGYDKMLLEMLKFVQGLEGYDEEDYNPHFEFCSAIENARDDLFYLKAYFADKDHEATMKGEETSVERGE